MKRWGLAELRPALANRSAIAAREVSAGGMKLLNVDEIAEPHDVLIVAWFCAIPLMALVLTSCEPQQYEPRIDHIAHQRDIHGTPGIAVHAAWQAIINSVTGIRLGLKKCVKKNWRFS